MTARRMDPVFAAALRAELEALADRAPSRPDVRPPARWLRLPVWVSVVTALLLVVATLGVLRLTGGGTGPATGDLVPPPGVTDPLRELLEPSSDAYLRARPEVLLHATASGTGEWRVTVPEGVTSVRPYVNCATRTRSTLVIDGESRTGVACAGRYAGSFADVPVEPGEHTVGVEPSRPTAYVVLLIATPDYEPSAARPAEPPLPYPALAGSDRVLARERGDARVVTGRLPGSMTGVRVVVTCRGEGAVTVATDFGTLGNPADFSGCRAAAPKRTGGGVGGDDAVRDPRFTITPYGEVSWTVTFLRLDP